MLVTTITYGRTVNKPKANGDKSFEFERIDVEAVPTPGQTADDCFTELREYVDSHIAVVIGGTPPKAKPAAQPEPDSKPAAKPEAESKAPAKKKRGRPKGSTKKRDHEKQLQFALDAESLEELRDRYSELRDMAFAFETDEWESANQQLAGRYRELNTAAADPDIQTELTAMFKAEKSAIAEQRAAA